MNERFYLLPEEKQKTIINAGFRVFSQNSYKKSPVSEIAAEAGISKALLFHYFRNKKELYLFLWERCGDITIQALKESGCYELRDIFDALYRSMQTKLEIMKKYPDLGNFAIKAYYEKDPEVVNEIKAYLEKYGAFKKAFPVHYDPEQFREGLDLKMMYRDMYLASEGYIWEKLQYDQVDVDIIEKEYSELIHFWKDIYLRKEK